MSMHYATEESNQKVSKLLNVKAQFLLNCDPNFEIPLLTGEQLFKYWGKIFSLHICQKCVICCQKKQCWCQVKKNCELVWYKQSQRQSQRPHIVFKPQILQTSKLQIANKKTNQISFLPDAVLKLVFKSSPQFYSHPACRLELQLTLCRFSLCRRLCSTCTQILFKSETAQLAISKYFCLK